MKGREGKAVLQSRTRSTKDPILPSQAAHSFSTHDDTYVPKHITIGLLIELALSLSTHTPPLEDGVGPNAASPESLFLWQR